MSVRVAECRNLFGKKFQNPLYNHEQMCYNVSILQKRGTIMAELDRITSVCFTGHRDIDKNSAYFIPSALKATVRTLIELGATTFLCGGAVGFDTIAALCIIELKEEYPDIRLHLVLPCKNQTRMWNETSRTIYDMILKRADRVEYLHESYTQNCMHDRNRRLVDLADVCIAYCVHSGGGTAYTMSYALKCNKQLINIYVNVNKPL